MASATPNRDEITTDLAGFQAFLQLTRFRINAPHSQHKERRVCGCVDS